MYNFSFIIPCYNCESFIFNNIKRLENKLKSLKISYELILVDDGSTDKTLEKLNSVSKKHKSIKILKNTKNIGKSYSTLKGIKKSKFNNIVTIDCDLPYFNSIHKIINLLKKGNHLVIINRKLNESKLINKNLNIYQISRYIIGTIIAYINLKILNLNIYGGDSQAGLKGFKKIKNFNKLKFISKKFFFDLELILFYSKKKLNIISIKTNYLIPKNSSIKIFNILKNIEILRELISIITIHKKN